MAPQCDNMEGSETNMKKTLILISIFMIILVSCSGKKSAVNTTANKIIGLPNPVQESTAEDIAKELNVKFAVQDGAKNIRYSIVSGNLAQMDFILNEAECTARIQRDAETEDISGFYYNWSNETPCTVGANAGIVKWQITEVGEVVGICLWQNKASNLTYSVSMKKMLTVKNLLHWQMLCILQEVHR